MTVKFLCRDMTDEEYQREQIAFNEHGAEFGNPPEKQERYGFVAMDNEKFVGCSSGLALRYDNQYCKYFYLSDLLVEKEYRKFGYGKKLLDLLEEKVKSLGMEYVYTWTAGYEAPKFYQKQGYEIFTTFKGWYISGHGKVGLIKKL